MNREQRRAARRAARASSPRGGTGGGAADGNPQQVLDRAMQAHQAGRLDEAVQGYRAVLKWEPAQPDVLNLLGGALVAGGRPKEGIACYERALKARPGFTHALVNLGLARLDAGEGEAALAALEEAAALAPQVAEIHGALGDACRRLGRLDAAIDSYRRAADLDPKDPVAANNLGGALVEAGRADDAIAPLRKAVALAPDYALAHCNLGDALRDHGDAVGAMPHFRRAVHLDPEFGDAILALANNLIAVDRDAAGALVLYERLIAIDPADIPAKVNRTIALRDLSRFAEAEAALDGILADTPTEMTAWRQLGLVRLAQDRREEAVAALMQPCWRLRDPASTAMPPTLDNDHRPRPFTLTNRTKLRHDGEQLEHLVAKGILGAEQSAIAVECRELADTLADERDHDLLDLGASPALVRQYNRLIYRDPGAALPEGTLNPEADFAAVERAYHATQPGTAMVDNVLSPAALEGLRRFAMDSTIWYNLSDAGDLGAAMYDGFCCPLVLQIGQDLRRAMPTVFGPHIFMNCWGYKYYRNRSGIDIHTDTGAVSLNVWLTPDSANNDPETGGLILWNRKAPKNLFSRKCLRDEKREMMRTVLDEPGAEARHVPHRCNRALIFHSNVVHKTDTLDFKDGYENRRINMTFLFGRPQWED